MVVPSSSVNMERLKDGNVYVGCLFFQISFYARKWRSLLTLNLTKKTIKEINEI